jgi:hypothetical protein
VLDAVRTEGPGIYVLGLDSHVGFLVHHKHGNIEMCHASGVSRHGRVVCEQPLPAMHSEYRVIGKLFDDAMIEAWLQERSIPVRVWKRRR